MEFESYNPIGIINQLAMKAPKQNKERYNDNVIELIFNKSQKAVFSFNQNQTYNAIGDYEMEEFKQICFYEIS